VDITIQAMNYPAPSGDGGFLQSLIDSISDPVFVKDREHRWVLFNGAFVALLGHSRERLLGKSDFEFFPKAQAEVFFRQDELVFETGRENANEETLTDAAGRTHVLVTKKTRWISPDGEKYLVGVIRNITEIVGAVEDSRRSKERLRRAEKLETLGSLAGGAAHDFNNLLTAIRGCASLLIDSLPAGHPSRIEAEEIRRAGERASVLTDRLLSFSRRPEGLERPVCLRAIVKDMHPMLRRLLPADVELKAALPRNLGAICVDPGLVEQVLLNLVVNAGAAMPRGGRVTIEVAEAKFGGAGVPGPCIRLTVRDNGAGMTDSIRARIFEPFFTTKERGSGLGLSTVAEAIRRSAGGVQVDSAPGKGSLFHVFWPRAVAKVTAAKKLRALALPAPGKGRGRALVVEDDDAVRRFSVRCLEREGYEVLSAGDPAEALRICEANEGLFELLVIDVVLPLMRGPELARRLCGRQPEARVLFTSGRRREDCGLPNDGRANFLPKPYSASDLLEKVSAGRRGAGGPSRRARRPGPARSRRTAS